MAGYIIFLYFHYYHNTVTGTRDKKEGERTLVFISYAVGRDR